MILLVHRNANLPDKVALRVHALVQSFFFRQISWLGLYSFVYCSRYRQLRLLLFHKVDLVAGDGSLLTQLLQLDIEVFFGWDGEGAST